MPIACALFCNPTKANKSIFWNKIPAFKGKRHTTKPKGGASLRGISFFIDSLLHALSGTKDRQEETNAHKKSSSQDKFCELLCLYQCFFWHVQSSSLCFFHAERTYNEVQHNWSYILLFDNYLFTIDYINALRQSIYFVNIGFA